MCTILTHSNQPFRDRSAARFDQRHRRVVELGSGLGFDGLRFATHGAFWTFADIVPDNLAVIRRIATLKGLIAQVRFHLIGDDLSFAPLPANYDAVWVFGSIHHVPFEVARREALDVLGHLKSGGRWMELAIRASAGCARVRRRSINGAS